MSACKLKKLKISMDTSEFIQIVGPEKPTKAIAIEDIKLSNPCLTFIPAAAPELASSIIPKGQKGKIEEITSAICRLNFSFVDKSSDSPQQAIFWIKRRDLDRFFLSK